jgi:hypothetical protein
VKKLTLALCLLFAGPVLATESSTGPSGGTFIDSLRVMSVNQAVYVYTSTAFWTANNVWRIDLSTSNAFGRDMLAVALSAINTGKAVKITVNVDAGPPAGDCNGTTAAPTCPFAPFIRSIILRN